RIVRPMSNSSGRGSSSIGNFAAPTIERSKRCENCVAGNAVVLADGRATRLDETHESARVFSKTGWNPTNAWQYSGYQETLEIKTNYGLRLQVTPDHRVATERGWVAAIDLREKDVVTTLLEQQLSHINRIDPNDALAYGLLTGDGWANPVHGVGFGCAGPNVKSFMPPVQKFAEEHFGSTAKIRLQHGQNDFFRVDWRTAKAFAFAKTFDKSRVPHEVWGSTPSVRGAYLRGLFSADGSVAKRSPQVMFFQTTERLIDEVQLLLRTLGIPSYKRVVIRAPRYKDLFSLHVGRKFALERFADLVGFADERRQRVLYEGIRSIGRSSGTPERVIRVTPAGWVPVYDISVPNDQNFFANGMLVHNCLLWDRSDAAIAHYKQKRFADIQHVAKEVLANDGKTTRRARDAQIARLGDDDPHMAQLGSNYEMGDNLIREGKLGICIANNAEGDFVHAYYLCDKWQQRVKPDGADGFDDELPEDARKRVYGDDA
ncbi:hypothetical protein LCGC14_2456890, partial [marine sediment metagenome]